MVATLGWSILFFCGLGESKFFYIVRVAKVPPVEELWETGELIKYILWLV